MKPRVAYILSALLGLALGLAYMAIVITFF